MNLGYKTSEVEEEQPELVLAEQSSQEDDWNSASQPRFSS